MSGARRHHHYQPCECDGGRKQNKKKM